MPVGSIYYTPEQQRNYKERKEREAEQALRREALCPLGKFYFVLSEEQFQGVSPESVTRLIFLNTFMDYRNNRLMLSERTPMKRKDLVSVLNVSKATVSRFWKEVAPKYIAEYDDGLIFSNSETFKRGTLPKKKYITYQKIYIEGVRKLYQSTSIKYHRQLGYFFKLLPFINVEYNLLCYPESVLSKNIENIELISISDFCHWIDYDVSQLYKLVNIYQTIVFDVGNRKERFCTLIYDGVDKKNAKICINPHIFYSGSDYGKVEVFGAFCKL